MPRIAPLGQLPEEGFDFALPKQRIFPVFHAAKVETAAILDFHMAVEMADGFDDPFTLFHD